MAYKYGSAGKMQVGTSDILQIRNWRIVITQEEYDVSCLGDGWAKPTPVLMSWQGSAEGIYDPADTNGQLVLQNAAISGTKVQPEFWVDGTKYWAPDTSADTSAGAYVQNVTMNLARAALGIVDFTFRGHGPLKYN